MVPGSSRTRTVVCAWISMERAATSRSRWVLRRCEPSAAAPGSDGSDGARACSPAGGEWGDGLTDAQGQPHGVWLRGDAPEALVNFHGPLVGGPNGSSMLRTSGVRG